MKYFFMVAFPVVFVFGVLAFQVDSERNTRGAELSEKYVGRVCKFNGSDAYVVSVFMRFYDPGTETAQISTEQFGKILVELDKVDCGADHEQES